MNAHRQVPRRALQLFLFVGMLLGLTLLCPAPVAHTATYTVTNLSDNGLGSLRDAITTAMGAGAADTINFNVSGTIPLASTLPNITAAGGALTIDGTGHTITISGNHTVGIFVVDSGASLTL